MVFCVTYVRCESVSAEISRATPPSSKKGRRERRDIENRARRGAGEEEREIWSKREGERMHIANNEYVDPDKEQEKKEEEEEDEDESHEIDACIAWR